MDNYKIKRNERIRREFSELYDKKKLRIDYCLNCLAEKYGIRPQTIMHIIKGYGIYNYHIATSNASS